MSPKMTTRFVAGPLNVSSARNAAVIEAGLAL
jgi:hypothetical protein